MGTHRDHAVCLMSREEEGMITKGEEFRGAGADQRGGRVRKAGKLVLGKCAGFSPGMSVLRV